MNKLKSFLAAGAILAATMGQAHASIIFSFTEASGTVSMQTSGTLNTANLVEQNTAWWGGAGVETNAAPQSDIMGDTTIGSLDRFFGFHNGTDLSPWIGNMFTSSNFAWASTGTTQFSTYNYISSGNGRTPGIAIGSEDLVGALWTPNVSWVSSGSFASLGLTVGNYSVVDAVTNESITIRIGKPNTNVPEPSIFVLFAIGLLGLAVRRRKA